VSDLGQIWKAKLEAAEKVYQDWEAKFKVKQLEDYEEGFQWAEGVEAYVMNMIYATIEIKEPVLSFERPVVSVVPKPSAIEKDPDYAFQYAQNSQDLANTWLLDYKNKFSSEISAAIADLWSRFAVVEIGYSADWVDNPKVRKPKLRADYSKLAEDDKRRVAQKPAKIPKNERVYVKAIPAEDFRVSANSGLNIEDCDWCGYWEWVKADDLIASDIITNKEAIRNHSVQSQEQDLLLSYKQNRDKNQTVDGDLVRIFKVWDLRAQRRYILLGDEVIYNKPYKRLPFVTLRLKRRKKNKGWYPLPFIFNWISPQNEINEIRETHRRHRRRFKRMYQALKGAFDEPQEEIQKMINGPDGTVIFVTRMPAIEPIKNADLGTSSMVALQTPFDDFNRISGTTSEMRGQSDRTTATQAMLANSRAQIRETKERIKVKNFIERIIRMVILTHRDNFIEPIPIQRFPEEPFGTSVETEVQTETIDPLVDLGDEEFDFNVTFQVSALNPQIEQEEKQKFVEFLQLLSAFPQFSISPTLIRELAFRVGYRNEQVLKEFQQMAFLQGIGLLQAGVNNLQQQQLQQQQTAYPEQVESPGLEKIATQLENQLGV